MKKMFIFASVLMQFNLNRETLIETDFSEYIVENLLQQYDDDEFVRLCAFFFKKNLLAQCNYEIYDKKLLAIVECLKK